MTVEQQENVVTRQVSSDEFFADSDSLVTSESSATQEVVETKEQAPAQEAKDTDGEKFDWWGEESEGGTAEAQADATQPANLLTQLSAEYGIEPTEDAAVFKERLDAKIRAMSSVAEPDELSYLRQYVTLNAEDVIYEHLKVKMEEDPLFSITEDEIEDKIQDLKDRGELEKAAEKILKPKQERLTQLEADYQKSIKDHEAEVVKQRQVIASTIESFSTFDGVKLNPRQASELKRFVLDGEFAKTILETPEGIALAAFYAHPMGKEYLKKMQAEFVKKGKSSVYRSLESSDVRVGQPTEVPNGAKTRLVSSDEFYN